MALSPSSSDSDTEDDMATLNRIFAKSGAFASESLNDNSDSDSDSSGIDVQGWFRQIQEKFSMASGDADPFPVIKPLSSKAPSEDSDDEDVMETVAAIHRRFDQYQNDSIKEQEVLQQQTDMAVNNVTLGKEITDALSKDLKHTNMLPESSFTDLHKSVDGSCDLSVKAFVHSQFPQSAQNFVDALKKNRSCQRFIRRKLIEIEAKIEENKKLKERIKCLIDFQLSCKRKVGHILCQKRDPRVKLISMQKPTIAKVQPYKKVPALYCGPLENSHVSKYKMVLKRFPVSFRKHQWSNVEKENLAKGIKQQYQEMLLLNSMNLENDLESSMNPDLMSALLSNDLEVTPEKIRSFLPLVNWDRLASMYLTGRSGAECESRWLNCEDLLINHGVWTMLEDKKLLLIVQERGIYNWIDISVMLGTQRTPFQCLARYQRSLNPHILNKDWTEEEDNMLRTAVEIFGDKNWQLVASNLEGRTGTQCSNRWRKTLNPDRRKVGRWSVDEDKRLKVAVMLFGAKNWNKIADFAPGRTQVQCRERWLNCLDPSLKLDAWTEEEDDMLKLAIEEHGHSWSRVAACVPGRTDNQCMRRWKRLFPEEVLSLQEARQMKKTVLISNFVDRESERPSIGPSDFSSLIHLPISECGNSSRGGKQKLREGARKKNQRNASRDKKIKKSRAKSTRFPEENLAEGGSLCSPETPFDDSCLVPAEPDVRANNSENGSTKRSRKSVPRNLNDREGPQLKVRRTVSRKPEKSKIKCRTSLKENVTACDMVNHPPEIALGDSCMVSAENSYTPDGGTMRRIRKKIPSASQRKKAAAFVIENQDENVTTNDTVLTTEIAPEDASLCPDLNIAANERNIKKSRKKQASDNDLQIRRSRKSTAKDKTLIKGISATVSNVDVCADEDVPLVSWLGSLAFEARSKRLTFTSSRTGAVNQKESCCEKPGAKRKRLSKEPIENISPGCDNNTLTESENNESCYLASKQKGISNQSADGGDIVQVEHTMVGADASAPLADGAPCNEDVPVCLTNSTNEISSAVISKTARDDDSLLGFLLKNKAKRKKQCLDGEATAKP